jgi:adenylate cyclase
MDNGLFNIVGEGVIMAELERTKNGLISSIDILDRTGLSRATLNNYIKMGIIPRPIVRKPEKASIKARQIGYFPSSVLDTIKEIIQYKSEGYSMDEICDHMRLKANDLPITADSVTSDADEQAGDNKKQMPDEERRTDQEMSDIMIAVKTNEIKLTINDLQCPAYLISNNFEIDWINTEAEETIFGQNIHSITIAESRNIFRLFIGMGLMQSVESRHAILDFHMSLFKQRSSKEELEKLFPGIT